MSILWIGIKGADDDTRASAVEALAQAGIAVVGGAGATWTGMLGGWWIAAAVLLALLGLFGVAGFFADTQKKHRPERKTP